MPAACGWPHAARRPVLLPDSIDSRPLRCYKNSTPGARARMEGPSGGREKGGPERRSLNRLSRTGTLAEAVSGVQGTLARCACVPQVHRVRFRG